MGGVDRAEEGRGDEPSPGASGTTTPPPPAAATRLLMDGIAGASVALVLIPQGMAYAELAGMPAHHGLYASGLPLMLAALFASSPYLQGGPVATTSLLTVGALSSLATPGSGEYVALAALLAVIVGVVRVGVGLLRAGAVSYLLSQPLLQGFMTGAAVLILASQLPSALGSQVDDALVLSRALAALMRPGAWDPAALGLSGVTLALMLGGRRLHPLFPGVLVAVVTGIGFSVLTGYAGPVIGEVPATVLPPLSFDLPWHRVPELLLSGTILALVGFAEAASVSQTFAEKTRKPWNPDREFVSQGVANLTSGLVGGFPVGGSFSRSALGRLAGAQSAAAGAISGLVVVLFLPGSFLFAPLPKAVLGAIVIGAVLGLLRLRRLVSLWRQSKLQALVAYATLALTLYLAPHVEYAVLGGIAIALAVHVWREQAVKVDAYVDGDVLTLIPQGVMWYASAPQFRQAMATQVARHERIVAVRFDLGSLGRIDLTGALVLRELIETLDDQLHVELARVPPHAERVLSRVCPELMEAGDSLPPKSGRLDSRASSPHPDADRCSGAD